MIHIRVVKWREHQHYKDRNPPWIKLHRAMLSSRTWVGASNETRVLAVAIMLLASDTENLTPLDTSSPISGHYSTSSSLNLLMNQEKC
jgi:hypothetical protein